MTSTPTTPEPTVDIFITPSTPPQSPAPSFGVAKRVPKKKTAEDEEKSKKAKVAKNKAKTEKTTVSRRYNYGFTPTDAQKVYIDAHLNASRCVINDTLRFLEAEYLEWKKWSEHYDVKNNVEARAKNVPQFINMTLAELQKRVLTNAKSLSGMDEQEIARLPEELRIDMPFFERVPAISEKTSKEYFKYELVSGKFVNPERGFLATTVFDEPIHGVSEVKISATTLQQAVQVAYRSVMDAKTVEGRRFPKYKRTEDVTSLNFTAMRNSVQQIDIKTDGEETRKTKFYAVKLPNLPGGTIKVKMKRPLPSPPTSMRLIKHPTGRYEVSFVVEVPKVDPLPKTGVEAGVDLGLKDLAAIHYFSDKPLTKETEILTNERFMKKRAKHMGRLQKQLSKMEKGSNNYNKKKAQIAKLHSRVAKTRKIHREQVVNKLISETDFIGIETLNITSMAKRAKTGRKRFGKSIADVSWGALISLLEQKASETGRTVERIGTFYASTQLCSNCGAKTGPKGKKDLGVRKWTCSECNASHHRDLNASKNIYKESKRVHALKNTSK